MCFLCDKCLLAYKQDQLIRLPLTYIKIVLLYLMPLVLYHYNIDNASLGKDFVWFVCCFMLCVSVGLVVFCCCWVGCFCCYCCWGGCCLCCVVFVLLLRVFFVWFFVCFFNWRCHNFTMTVFPKILFSFALKCRHCILKYILIKKCTTNSVNMLLNFFLITTEWSITLCNFSWVSTECCQVMLSANIQPCWGVLPIMVQSSQSARFDTFINIIRWIEKKQKTHSQHTHTKNKIYIYFFFFRNLDILNVIVYTCKVLKI